MEKKPMMWEVVDGVKRDLINKVVNAIGGKTLDLSKENVYVFAIEHHCSEGICGKLGTISEDGFTMDDDGEELVWKDMIVEDLAMVYDYLLTGKW